MNSEIQELNSKLFKLRSFLDGYSFSEGEIIGWVSDCVAFFSKIQMNEAIIASFLKSFENHLNLNKQELIKNTYLDSTLLNGIEVFYLGPFSRTRDSHTYSKLFRNKEFLYLEVALKTAEEIINAREERERLIPVSLIKSFDTEKTQNIGPRLQSLYDQKVIHEKYGLNKDIIWALNTSRIIRNEEIEHQKKEHLGNVPMYEAIGCGHLLVLFSNSLLASGEIIL